MMVIGERMCQPHVHSWATLTCGGGCTTISVPHLLFHSMKAHIIVHAVIDFHPSVGVFHTRTHPLYTTHTAPNKRSFTHTCMPVSHAKVLVLTPVVHSE